MIVDDVDVEALEAELGPLTPDEIELAREVTRRLKASGTWHDCQTGEEWVDGVQVSPPRATISVSHERHDGMMDRAARRRARTH